MRSRRTALIAMGITCLALTAYNIAVAEPSPLGCCKSPDGMHRWGKPKRPKDQWKDAQGNCYRTLWYDCKICGTTHSEREYEACK